MYMLTELLGQGSA